MLSESVFKMLQQIARGLGRQFGSNCEVAVYKVDAKSLECGVVAVENGHVSRRAMGDGPGRAILEALAKEPWEAADRLNRLTKTRDGRILKSSAFYIRDDAGEPGAILTIDYDITGFLAVEGSVRSLISAGETEESEPEDLPLNVHGLLDELISRSMKLVGKPVALMTKDDKIKAVQFLNHAGAFLITKSGDKISKHFEISKYTLYSYIDAGKD